MPSSTSENNGNGSNDFFVSSTSAASSSSKKGGGGGSKNSSLQTQTLLTQQQHQTPSSQPPQQETQQVVVVATSLPEQANNNTLSSPPPSPRSVAAGSASGGNVIIHTEMLPPELRDLFEISSFIAHARPMMKPCFRTRTYVTKDSWIGAIFRRFHGESAMLGALQIQRISERLSSSLQQHRGKVWDPIVRTHLNDFLKGVKIIQETYFDYTEVTPILSTSMLTVEHALNYCCGQLSFSSATPGTSVSSQAY